jgi:hypothetical protein
MDLKRTSCAAISVALLLGSAGRCKTQVPRAIRFDQYPAQLYRGRRVVPREFHKNPDGSWQDESGKPASQPAINFAGEYYLAAHSCGTCCRYYTLDNLRQGGAVKQVGMFDATDPSPLTRDGRTYVPILFFRPDSNLLLVQYELDLCTPVVHNECRQRFFVFENGRFKAISGTLQHCPREGAEPE